LDGIAHLAKYLQFHAAAVGDQVGWIEECQADAVGADRDVLDGRSDNLGVGQPLGGEIGSLPVDLDADQLSMWIVLERREQIALATGAVDYREVAAGECEQVVCDLLGACVGCGLVSGVRDIGQGSKSYDLLLC
jgi:hypothetical protein